MPKPMVALSGGIASGKSLVSDLFADCGITIIDCDVIAHQLTASNGKAIPFLRQAFGESIFINKNQLNRARLRKIIFNDIKQKNKLENILHGMIFERCQRLIKACKTSYGIVVIPLLINSQYLDICRRIIMVDVPLQTQLNRAKQRDSSSTTEIIKIIKQQSSREQRLQYADFIIDNSGDENYSKLQVTQLHQHLLALFAS